MINFFLTLARSLSHFIMFLLAHALFYSAILTGFKSINLTPVSLLLSTVCACVLFCWVYSGSSTLVSSVFLEAVMLIAGLQRCINSKERSPAPHPPQTRRPGWWTCRWMVGVQAPEEGKSAEIWMDDDRRDAEMDEHERVEEDKRAGRACVRV